MSPKPKREGPRSDIVEDRERLSLASPVLSAKEEQEILNRVEESLMRTLFEASEHEESETAKGWRERLFSWQALAVTATAALLIFSATIFYEQMSSSPSLIPMNRSKGFIAEGLIPHRKTQETWKLRLAKAQEGALEVKGHWKLKATRGTSITLRRQQGHHLDVELLKGHVELAVVPHSMKHLQVSCGDLKVIVKGTIFSVNRGKKWARVEVWRGKVLILQKGQRYFLTAHRGMRFDLQCPQKIHRYPLPNHRFASLERRLQWFAQHPEQLKKEQQFVEDLLALKTERNEQNLDGIIAFIEDIIAKKLHRWQQAQSLLLKISEMPISSSRRSYALFKSAQFCLKAQKQKLRCFQLLKRYTTLYPKGSFAPLAREILRNSR